MEREFRGVFIDKSIWFDTRLNALEKVILVEIDSLDKEETGCYAGNDYIAQFCQCSESKVSKSISKLIELGYIYVESFNGRKRILRSRLSENTRLPSKKCQAEKQKKQGTIIYNNKEKETYNLNNKSNNKVDYSVAKRKYTKKPFVPPTLQEVEEYCRERNSCVDPKRFYDYFSTPDDEGRTWIDSKGNPVRNWKQKIIVWEGSNQSQKKTSYQEQPRRKSFIEIAEEMDREDGLL